MLVISVSVLSLFLIMSDCTIIDNGRSPDVDQLMTAEEKLGTFGHSKIVPEYQLVKPIQRHLQRDNRFSDDDPHLEVHLWKNNDDHKIVLQLKKTTGLVSPNFTMNMLDAENNLSRKRRFPDHPDCLYHGIVQGANTEVGNHVALSTCSSEGMMGVIHVSNQRYVLVPVPRRLRRRSANSDTSGDRHPQHEHILYRKQDTKDKFCALDKNSPEVIIGNSPYKSFESNDSNRVRRQDTSRLEKTIELAVFVDDIYYDIMQRHYPDDPEGAILDMVLTLVNAVQLIYNQQSLSVQINFVLVHVNILKSAAKGPAKEDGEIKKYLKSFCAWQYKLNEPEGVDQHWDHALMLTGLDMYLGNPTNNVVIGLSWVSGMCHTKYSCSINEGTNFESVYVISHELGHNLGMQHDGLDNQCKNNTHLMSASLGPGKTSWSTCSNEYLRKYLNNDYASCMDNVVKQSEAMDYRSSDLPGQKYSASRQCHLSFGRKHRPYIINEAPFEDICRELWCANGTIARRAHPALDGTTCLVNKVCFHGECIDIEDVENELVKTRTL